MKIRLGTEVGYAGVFTRHHADGAIENGARIEKLREAPGDAHRRGVAVAVAGSAIRRAP